jgi:hypothetical protein
MTLATLESQAAAARTAAIAKWRSLVHAAANGSEPTLADVENAAAALSIADPVGRLRADAELVQQHRQHQAQWDAAAARIAQVLAPYGGSASGLEDAIADAEARLRELRQVFNHYHHGLAWSKGAAEGSIARLEGARPDLFAQ